MNTHLKARLFPEPDPLAVILYRIVRLTMLPPPPAERAPEPRFTAAPTSDTWRAVVETAVPTVAPGRS